MPELLLSMDSTLLPGPFLGVPLKIFLAGQVLMRHKNQIKRKNKWTEKKLRTQRYVVPTSHKDSVNRLANNPALEVYNDIYYFSCLTNFWFCST